MNKMFRLSYSSPCKPSQPKLCDLIINVQCNSVTGRYCIQNTQGFSYSPPYPQQPEQSICKYLDCPQQMLPLCQALQWDHQVCPDSKS
jgi:hypothetical protein